MPSSDRAAPGDVQSVMARVHQAMPRLTPAERRVAHTLLSGQPTTGLDTVAALARRAGTSGPTVLRFIAKLGFETYQAFQRSLRLDLEIALESPVSRYDHARRDDARDGAPPADPLDRLAEALSRNVALAFDALPRSEYEAVLDLLADETRPVYTLGGRFSRAVALSLHESLSHLRRGVVWIDGPTEAWATTLMDLGRRDTLLVCDVRRYQRDVVRFAEQAAAQGAVVVLLTDPWHSPIARQARHVLACPVSAPSAFDSSVALLAMAEGLVAGLCDRLGARGRDRLARLEAVRAEAAGAAGAEWPTGLQAPEAVRTVRLKSAPRPARDRDRGDDRPDPTDRRNQGRNR